MQTNVVEQLADRLTVEMEDAEHAAAREATEREQKREELRSELAALLRRAAQPHNGDADELERVVRELALTPDQIRAAERVVRDVDQAIECHHNLEELRDRARAARDAAAAEIERHRSALKAAESAAARATEELNDARRAANTIPALRREHGWAFAGVEVDELPDPSPMPEPPTADDTKGTVIRLGRVDS